jgi:hypothetical protein
MVKHQSGFPALILTLFVMGNVSAAGISVLTPSVNQVMAMDKTYSISWSYDTTPQPESVIIKLYKTDIFERIIAFSVLNATSHPWLIPSGLDTAALYRVKISSTSDSTVFGLSETFFIKDSSLIITAPKPDSSYSLNSSSGMGIEWKTNGSFPSYNFSLTLYTGNDSVLEINPNYAGSSSNWTSWKIPKTLDTSKVYRVKITSIAKPSVYRFSDNFRVTNLWDIQVVYPDSTVSKKAGEKLEIAWWGTYPNNNPKVELHRNGVFVSPVNAIISSSMCTWTIPDTLPTDSTYTIKVYEENIPTNCSFSKKFKIVNIPVITLYGQSGAVIEGTSYSVNWTSSGLVDTIKGSLSLDTGKTWSDLFSSVVLKDSKTINLPVINAFTNAMFRTISSKNPLVGDTIVFTIGYKPTLVSPINIIETNSRLPFIWRSQKRAQSYLVVIGTDATFLKPILSLPVTDTIYTPTIDLMPGTYFWKVVPLSIDVYSSATATFTIQNNLIPLAVVMKPDFTINRRPTMKWHPVPGAAGYQFEISGDSKFSSTLTVLPLTDTFYTPSADLPLGNIYWRVKSDLSTQYCAVQTIRIKSEFIPLLCTYDSATVATNKPVFVWHKVRDASSYVLEIFDSTNNRIVTITLPDTTYTPAAPLKNGLYMWWVKEASHNYDFSEMDYVRILMQVTGVVKNVLSESCVVDFSKAKKNIAITIATPVKTSISIRVYSIDGRRIYNKKLSCDAGIYDYTLMVPVMNGLHIVNIQIGKKTMSKTINVIH